MTLIFPTEIINLINEYSLYNDKCLHREKMITIHLELLEKTENIAGFLNGLELYDPKDDDKPPLSSRIVQGGVIAYFACFNRFVSSDCIINTPLNNPRNNVRFEFIRDYNVLNSGRRRVAPDMYYCRYRNGNSVDWSLTAKKLCKKIYCGDFDKDLLFIKYLFNSKLDTIVELSNNRLKFSVIHRKHGRMIIYSGRGAPKKLLNIPIRNGRGFAPSPRDPD